MVPFKELWRKLIAAWKTTSPHEVGPARTKSRDSWILMLINGQRSTHHSRYVATVRVPFVSLF
jgi:hypothetical protein